MLSLLYKIYFLLRKRKFNIIILRKFNSLLCILIRKIANSYMVINYKMSISNKSLGINTSDRRSKNVIVSLTTFPGRIDTVWIAIESLLRQSYQPDKIILWLAKEQFENINMLPKNILEQQERGLDIRFCDDLRSHKKYYYAFQEYSQDIIITVDDDIIYPENTLEELILLHKKYPEYICCHRGHLIKRNKDKSIAPYSKWIYNPLDFNGPSKLLCPTGVCGVLYPPDSINEEIYNKQSIKNLCFYADDLWLKVMSLKNNTKVVKSTSFPSELFTINLSQRESLAKLNVYENKNDKQLEAILNNYKVDLTE
ncbi:hypothetical protein P6709_06385 [Jeotgalibacillus sp. ET6]|uniref:hypothetical protein n=1 Tax=Jeotgalibacillus sp. ET6 TaxID=3037260 RepID=UPI00241855A3|nr:hypothetical protein [Jeotgalibacillus sp. ET6]MDG5471368.1 hypothetical protein [Jeotgalibacillus sp. ET6]